MSGKKSASLHRNDSPSKRSSEPPPKPLKANKPLQPRLQIEEIENDSLAADLVRRILRAGARTEARERKEQDNGGHSTGSD